MMKPANLSKMLVLLAASLLLGPTGPPRADDAPPHEHTRLCHLGDVLGFEPDVRRADTIVVGQATVTAQGELTVAVTRVLRGDPATRSVRVRSRADDSPGRLVRAG